MQFRIIGRGISFVLFLPAIMLAQSSQFSGTVTGGVGGTAPSGSRLSEFSAGPTFSGDLEFRFLKYVSAEIGEENLLPNYFISGSKYNAPGTSRVRVTLLPYGLRGILPVANHRGELFAGAGGAYFWRATDIDYSSASGALWQANVGARFALDRKRRFWLGTTVRLYRDPGRPTQQWLSATGDFGFRFGH